MQLFIKGFNQKCSTVNALTDSSILSVKNDIASQFGLPHSDLFNLFYGGRLLRNEYVLSDYLIDSGCTLSMNLSVKGGIDFQNRVGNKPGSGGVVSESQQNIDRRERLRKLALETVDLSKDPYFMKNHLGSFECKLCLTLHNNEGNYLAHTQGKRHQTNLARRAAKDAADAPGGSAAAVVKKTVVVPRRTIKIGLPGYRVTKQRDPQTGARILLFQIDYPAHEEGLQPRHRFMSSYEQKVETPDKDMQYLLFACEPYETVAFKVPNKEIDKSEGKFFSNWDKDGRTFTLQLYFKPEEEQSAARPLPPPPRPKLRYH